MNGQVSKDSHYVSQVRLLLSVLPDIAGEDVFALKGGTAINLFCRNMPRLSVDIDLTYKYGYFRDRFSLVGDRYAVKKERHVQISSYFLIYDTKK